MPVRTVYENSVGLELENNSSAETHGMSCVKTSDSAEQGREWSYAYYGPSTSGGKKYPVKNLQARVASGIVLI